MVQKRIGLNTGVSAVLVTIALLVPWQAQALDAQALELLQQGHRDCKYAHLNRRRNFDEAKSFYNSYLDLKKQAVEIDPGISTADDPSILRILTYCEKVGIDISRTEAMPVFKKGVEQCDLASRYVQQNQVAQAKKAYQKYLQYTGEAVEISQTLFRVFSALSDVLRCGRVFNEIQLAESRLNDTNKKLSSGRKQLQGVLSYCKALSAGENMGQAPQHFQTGLTEVSIRLSSIAPPVRLENTLPDSKEAKAIVKLRKGINDCVNVTDAIMTTRLELFMAEQQRLREKQAEQEAQAREQSKKQLLKNADYYKRVKQVAPRVSRKVRKNSGAGYVIVEFRIEISGDVLEAAVIESSLDNVFGEAVVTAVKQWKYRPEFTNRAPEIAYVRERISFDPDRDFIYEAALSD